MAVKQADLSSLKPKEQAYRVPFKNGLFFEILPDGTKFWRLNYQLAEKKETITLGKFPKFSLAEARQWRTQCLKLVGLGISPKALKQGEVSLTDLNPQQKQFAEIFLNNWCWSTVDQMLNKRKTKKNIKPKNPVVKNKTVEIDDIEAEDGITLEVFAKNLDLEIAELAKKKSVKTHQQKAHQTIAKTDETANKKSGLLKRLFSFGSNNKK